MKLADVIYKPQGGNRPSKEQVAQFAKEVMRIDYEEFINSETERFECQNGDVNIYGEFHPVKNPRGCVILAHGFGQNRYIMIPQEQMFRRLGFSTVLFDQRSFGESKEEFCTFGVEEGKDVACLIKWVKDRCGDDCHVILFGVSMGAATVMNALMHTKQVDYLIEDCGFASLRKVAFSLYRSLGMGEPEDKIITELEEDTKKLGFELDDNTPMNVLSDKNIPICIIHGLDDSTIEEDNARDLFAMCRHHESRLELFEDKEHALCVTDMQRYENIIKEFLQKL